MDMERTTQHRKNNPWGWVLVGVAYGLVLRVLFGLPPVSGTYNGVMSAAFLFGAPVVAGALTVHGARDEGRSIWFAIFGPWLTVALMLLGSAVTLLEGSICIALMSPVFLASGSVGGLLMALVHRASRYANTNVSVIAVLPLLILGVETRSPLIEKEMEVRMSVLIEASAERVWSEILDARDISPDELTLSLTHFIGVPRPVEGINRQTPDGEIRFSKWERGVSFEGLVTERRENESIRWEYRFGDHSFPKGSMDDHVAIGGRFFDLSDTTFNLRPLPGNHTELEIVAHYRVSSSINFYAIPASRVLGHDFVSTILQLYKSRSEASQLTVTDQNQQPGRREPLSRSES